MRGPEAVAKQDPKKVVATIEGKPITAKEAVDMLNQLRPDERKRFESQGNLSMLLQQLYMQKDFAAEATKLNLQDQSPWKEQLETDRTRILAQAYVNKLSSTPASGAASEDPKKYYDEHSDEFDQVKLSGILVSFNAPGTPSANATTTRTEQEARDKANDLEKKLKGGSDFGALARSDSDDKRSTTAGGELGTFPMGPQGLPPEIKTAVSKLQPGQISDPVRVPTGFYIFRLDARTKVPFEQARTQIQDKWKNEKTQAVLKQEFDKYKIQVQDPDFFNVSNGPTARIPSLQQPAGANAASTPPSASPSQASAQPQPQH